ncbi:MAG: outer membrane lipoprotein-sorting protein [Sideroxydans sp.]|nr:outer membrane lipoprotein-sorting protein [Sideroxydans sp.]
MRKLNSIFAVGLMSLASVVYAAPDAHSILSNSDQARGGGLPGIVWEIKLNSRDGDKVDEPQRLVVKAVDESSVAEVLEPVRSKGSRILQVERNMWLTKPGLSKPIPISPRQRMSGQASNGDIAATNYAGDYEAQMSNNESVDGEPCYVLDLKAKHKRATYDKIRYWVSVKRLVGVKAEFQSVSGKLLKTAHFEYNSNIEHDGKRIPFISKMKIRDALVDAETVMEFGSVKVKRVAASEFDLGQMQ